MIPKKNKKRRVIIDPTDILPFEIDDKALAYYKQDEYKYLIHYARAFPDGSVPIIQYLLLRFHPLIIKVSGHYFPALDMEWRDLISFTRQKFIELIYRFNLCSSLYFRTYIQTALRRAIYDRVLFESRRKSLLDASSLEAMWSQANTSLNKELTCDAELPVEDYAAILSEVVKYVEDCTKLDDNEKKLFKLRFLEGCSLQQTCSKLGKPNFYVIARQRHIREVLADFIQKYLI